MVHQLTKIKLLLFAVVLTVSSILPTSGSLAPRAVAAEAVPAKPVINSPTFKEDIPMSEIYDSSSPRQVTFTPDVASPVVKSIIKIGGEFEGAVGYQNITLSQATDGNYRNLKDFAPGTTGALKYVADNQYMITVRSTTIANADENDASLWSEWSSERPFMVTASVPPANTLATPVINSPTEGESIPISEIYDSVSPRQVTFTPDANKPGVKTKITIHGKFDNGSGERWIALDQAADGNYRNLKDFAAGDTNKPFKYKVGNTYDIVMRSSVTIDDSVVYSEWAPMRQFTVAEGIPPANTLAAPTNLMPTNGSEVKNMFANFTWNTVAGATSYDVDISLDSGFAMLEKTYRNLPGVFTDSQQPFGFQPLKNHQDYYWRVRANDADNSSAWTVAHFTTNATNLGNGPTQIRPTNGEVLTTLSSIPLEFENNMAENYTKTGNEDYRFLLQASKTSDFSSIIMATIDTDVTSGKESILANIQDNTTYYWRVMMFTKTKITDWSTTSFTISTGQATSPTQIRPINGEIVTTARVLLEWENDPVANSIELGPDYDFLVEVSKVSDFSTTLQAGRYDAFDSSMWIYGEAEDNTTYYWRVRIFTDTKSSDWSATSFRVQLGEDTIEPTGPITPTSDPIDSAPPTVPGGESTSTQPNDNTATLAISQPPHQPVAEAKPEIIETTEETKTATSSAEDKQPENKGEVKSSEAKGLAWYWWVLIIIVITGTVWRGLVFFHSRSSKKF